MVTAELEVIDAATGVLTVTKDCDGTGFSAVYGSDTFHQFTPTTMRIESVDFTPESHMECVIPRRCLHPLTERFDHSLIGVASDDGEYVWSSGNTANVVNDPEVKTWVCLAYQIDKPEAFEGFTAAWISSIVFLNISVSGPLDRTVAFSPRSGKLISSFDDLPVSPSGSRPNVEKLRRNSRRPHSSAINFPSIPVSVNPPDTIYYYVEFEVTQTGEAAEPRTITFGPAYGNLAVWPD